MTVQKVSSSPKKALITGVTGQDGSFMAKLLLEKGYEVHGIRTYSAVPDTVNIQHLNNIDLHYADLTDSGSLTRMVFKISPDEIYNFAGQSHVQVSFEMPEHTGNVNALGVLRILECLRALKKEKDIKFYQASSSEMFGNASSPQNEQTAFAPVSPYGIAKTYAYWTVKHYREAYGMFAVNGILFNHESTIRGEHFVSRKITKAVGNIEAGQQDILYLGNLDAKRDWGHASDYMYAVWLIMQHHKPDDFVIATGQSKTVREFVEKAFDCIGINLIWQGQGINETGIDSNTGKTLVAINPELYRPAEINCLIGDAQKAKKVLNWDPVISFDEMVREMVQADRIVNKSNHLISSHG